jgi:hypothetical protein
LAKKHEVNRQATQRGIRRGHERFRTVSADCTPLPNTTYQGMKMQNFRITAIAAALTLAFSAGAMAIGMSKVDYQSGKAGIATEYKSAKAACDSFSANTKDVCVAEAKGKENVAKAELEAAYKPSVEATYKVRVAKADAVLSVAKEKCDDRSGNVKDICMKEAKADAVSAKADAKTQMKIAIANDKAAKTSAKANAAANETGVDARKDAASDKRDADYAVAKEKCDKFADDAKVTCVKDAKARFGQS